TTCGGQYMTQPDRRLVEEFLDAAQKNDAARLQTLLDQGVPLAARDAGGMTALHLAAQSNGVDVIRALLRAGLDVNIRTELGSTPLMAAAKAGAVAAATELVA